jgi:hypothetical protein
MRKRTRIGDLFAIKLDDWKLKFMQYIADDFTQLNSSVVRVFQSAYDADAVPDIDTIIDGEVELYAHCVLKWGVDQGHWEPFGNSQTLGTVEGIKFRSAEHAGGIKNPPVCNNWQVWKINEPMQFVNPLPPGYYDAYIGHVINPEGLAHRIKTGDYLFKEYYPPYK